MNFTFKKVASAQSCNCGGVGSIQKCDSVGWGGYDQINVIMWWVPLKSSHGVGKNSGLRFYMSYLAF